MASYTAVTLTLSPDLAALKQALLLFDRVCVTELERVRLFLMHFPDFYRELEWLEGRGLIVTPDIFADDDFIIPQSKTEKREIRHALNHLIQAFSGYQSLLKPILSRTEPPTDSEWRDMAGAIAEGLGSVYDTWLVCCGIDLRWSAAMFGIAGDAVPVYFDRDTREAAAALNNVISRMPDGNEPQGRLVKSDVIRIVLSSFPAPDETIPWEEILSFRADTEARRKWLALKVWINEVARATIPPAEIEDKLQQLLAEYTRYMELCHLKHRPSQLEVVAVTIAEAIENTFKFKFKNLAEMPFRLFREQAALLQAEQAAPGREVAYIVAARDQFS